MEAAVANKVRKSNTQTYYVWYSEPRGEWVRSDNDRRDQWQSKGIRYVHVMHVSESYKRPLNDAKDKYREELTITGTYKNEYVEEALPTVRVMRDDVMQMQVEWSY